MQLPPIIPLLYRIIRLGLLSRFLPTITVTGTTAVSTALTALGDLTGVAIGDVVTGTDIPTSPPTTIVAMDNAAHTGTLSQAATGVHTGPLVFTPPLTTTWKLRLGAVNRSLNDQVTLADLTPEEATFDNYPAGGIAVTWTPGYIAPGDVPSNESQLFQFIMTLNPAVVTNTIYYWWIDDGTNVIMCQSFEIPVPMAVFGAALKMLVEDSYPPGLPAVQVVP